MKLARYVYLALLVIALLALGVWQLFPGQADADRGESKVPARFVVDPDWPKQLPNNWLIGQVGGLAVDSHNNISQLLGSCFGQSGSTTNRAGTLQLPNNWLIGQVGGLAVDSHNNIWIIQLL